MFHGNLAGLEVVVHTETQDEGRVGLQVGCLHEDAGKLAPLVGHIVRPFHRGGQAAGGTHGLRDRQPREQRQQTDPLHRHLRDANKHRADHLTVCRGEERPALTPAADGLLLGEQHAHVRQLVAEAHAVGNIGVRGSGLLHHLHVAIPRLGQALTQGSGVKRCACGFIHGH